MQSLPFSGWQTQTFFQVSFFFQGIELSKIKFQGIYESNNHSFQGVLVFKNLVVHTPVWIKNGIPQWLYDAFYFTNIHLLHLASYIKWIYIHFKSYCLKYMYKLFHFFKFVARYFGHIALLQ